MNNTTTVIESQIDWLTCAVHNSRAADELEHYARMLARTGEGPTEREAPFRLKGYQGWQCGRVRFGSREGAAIVQLSGDTAARAFDDLAPIADSISRIDIATTVRLAERDDELGLRSYIQAERFYRNHSHAATPSYHGDADGGYTAYVGDRSSDWFLRIYNKESEQRDDTAGAEHYTRCWRYELECKGGTAPNLAAELLALDGDARAAAIQDMLHEYVHRHGMVAAFPKAGSVRLVPGFRRRSDRQSRLDWLQRSVAPTVAWLNQTGDAEDVFVALGLTQDLLASSRGIDPATGEILREPQS